jgi:tetratricopeptide (TPR) repeat protein
MVTQPEEQQEASAPNDEGERSTEVEQGTNTPQPPVEPPYKQSYWRWIAVSALVALMAYPLVPRVIERWRTPSAAAQPADFLALSLEFYRAGRYQDAVAAATMAVTQDPSSADGYNNLGVSYAALGQWDKADQSLQQALRLNPGNVLAKNNLVWVQGEKLKARAAAGSADFYLSQSVQEFQAGKFENCIQSAQAALRLRPSLAEAYNNISCCYIGLQKWDLAIQNAQEAIRLNPDFQLAKNNLAWAQSEQAKHAGRSESK